MTTKRQTIAENKTTRLKGEQTVKTTFNWEQPALKGLFMDTLPNERINGAQ